MSTALSSTDSARAKLGWLAEVRRAAADVGPLLSFRAGTLRGRARRYATIGLVTIGVITLLVAWLPGYLPEGNDRRLDVLILLPSAMFGILLLSVVSAAATGGGRELLPREQAVAYPVSTMTDHLGTLLMAPLNIAWLLQTWTLLGSVAYVVGPRPRLIEAEIVTVVWIVTATVLAQVVAWGIEWLRRGARGAWIVRGIGAGACMLLAWLVAADRLVPMLEHTWVGPQLALTVGGRGQNDQLYWALTMVILLTVMFGGVLLGAAVAGAVAGRQPRDELRLESAPYQPRPAPSSEFAALLRTDRVGIWRSVPLRRGVFVLGLMPGAVALAGGLEWEMLTVLPGLVASGGALLFGVNSWCLDGRGALWRDSLPVEPRRVFASRVVVLCEVLLFATALTLVLASLRAGLPSFDEVVAVLCSAVVVVLQVVSRSLRWSVSRPYAVDMRSSRATPAPPLVMVGYSSRLALSTTLTGLVFAVTARAGADWSVVVALPFVLFSAYRLVGASEAWADPDTRCRVVSTVAS